MAVMLDQAQILHASMEKKAKQFDRIVTEWKAKVSRYRIIRSTKDAATYRC
jgi:hypothetical protein